MSRYGFRGIEEIENEREGGEESCYDLQIVRDDEGRTREITFDGAFRVRL